MDSVNSTFWTVFFGVSAVLVLFGWFVIDKALSKKLVMWNWRKPTSSHFNEKALIKLRDLADNLREEAGLGGHSHLVGLRIASALRLSAVGMLLGQANSGRQVERLLSLAFRQIAIDMPSMPAKRDRLMQFSHELRRLLEAIEAEYLPDVLEACATLFQLAHLPDKVSNLPELITEVLSYSRFKHEFLRHLTSPIDNVGFFHFLEEWKDLCLAKDKHLFVLIRVLDSFRRPLSHLTYVDRESDDAIFHLSKQVSDYLDGVRHGNHLILYRALCDIVTSLQLVTEGVDEDSYVVRPERSRMAISASPAPLRARAPEPASVNP